MLVRCLRTEYRRLRPNKGKTDQVRDLMVDVEGDATTLTIRIGSEFRRQFGMLTKARREAICSTMPREVCLVPSCNRKRTPSYGIHPDDLEEWIHEAGRRIEDATSHTLLAKWS